MTVERYPEWWFVRVDRGCVLSLAVPGHDGALAGRIDGHYVVVGAQRQPFVEPVSPAARSRAFLLCDAYAARDDAITVTWLDVDSPAAQRLVDAVRRAKGDG